MARTVLVTLTSFIVFAGFAVHAPAAGAHVEVRASDPAADDTAPAGLEEVHITFLSLDASEPVTVQVHDEEGHDVVSGDPELSTIDSVVTVPVEPLEEGAYTVVWQAMSDDGDGLSQDSFDFVAEASAGTGAGIWLVWLVALGLPIAIFLRPGTRTGRGRSRRDTP